MFLRPATPSNWLWGTSRAVPRECRIGRASPSSLSGLRGWVLGCCARRVSQTRHSAHEERPGLAQFTIVHDVELDEYDRLRRPYAMTRCRCCTLCLAAAVCSAWFLILAGIASGGWTFSQFGQTLSFAGCSAIAGGLFIEVGASDGITNSNSYLFEAFHGYRGICVEPGPRQGLLSWLRP